MSAIDTAVEIWKTWSPWILASLIPSLIIGFSLSPKTSKIANALKKILEFLSVLTYKDAAGTFKLPFTVKKTKKLSPPGTFNLPCPPEESCCDTHKKDDEPPKPPISPVIAALLLFGFVSVTTATQGCGWLSSIWGGTKPYLIDCAVEATKANAAHILPIIKDILVGDKSTWKKDLVNMIKEWGKDAVACAMQQIGQDLLTMTGPEGGTPTPEQASARTGLTKARQFVSEQGWKYKTE